MIYHRIAILRYDSRINVSVVLGSMWVGSMPYKARANRVRLTLGGVLTCFAWYLVVTTQSHE